MYGEQNGFIIVIIIVTGKKFTGRRIINREYVLNVLLWLVGAQCLFVHHRVAANSPLLSTVVASGGGGNTRPYSYIWPKRICIFNQNKQEEGPKREWPLEFMVEDEMEEVIVGYLFINIIKGIRWHNCIALTDDLLV